MNDKRYRAPRRDWLKLTDLQFRQRIAGTGMKLSSKAADACRLVFCYGMTTTEAAKRVGIAENLVNVRCHLLEKATPQSTCPKCDSKIV